MLETVITFTRYWFVFQFGSFMAVSFVGMPPTRKNYLALISFVTMLFLIQCVCLNAFGMEQTMKLYFLLSHLPVVLFCKFYLKRSLLLSIASMFASVLCCQPPRWIGTLMGAITGSASANHISYMISAILFYHLTNRYVTPSVRHLIERSVKSCLLFTAMPAFHYGFDYSTTVFTNLIYNRTILTLQLMSFATATFYFIFILFYYKETQKQANIERERDMLNTQLRQAQVEFASMRKIEQNSLAYRHDMRHHFAFLQSLASKGYIDEIREYLNTALSDMDAITPVRYSENETVNLILCSFAAKAEKAKIDLVIEAKMPNCHVFSDTEICSLLSNALENAIQACEKISDYKERSIKLRVYSKNTKLCIDIRNTYSIEPILENGLPITHEQGHGVGTKSMAQIIEKHGGVYRFFAKDGWFIFQASA